MALDKDGKLAPEIKSIGDAWNDHVNKNMNADAFTPEWMKANPTNEAIQKQVVDLNKKVNAFTQQQGQDVNQQQNQQSDPNKGWGVNQFDKWREEAKQKDMNPDMTQKDPAMDKNKDKGISR